MLKLFNRKEKSVLGIDISSTSVKIIEVSGDFENPIILGYGIESFPENTVEGNAIKDVDLIAVSVKRLIARHRFQSKQAALAVPDSAVISKTVQMNDGLTDQEMEELVVIEADKYIPYPIDEINLDFQILGPSAKGNSMLDVLIVASRSENVSARVEAITQAGLEAKVVDVESYAVERAVQVLKKELPAEGADKIVAIIDIGALYTHLFVLHGMKLVFNREEEFGSRILIESIMQRYGLNFEQAMESCTMNKLPEDAAELVIKPFMDMILLQIKRTLQFFYSTSHHSFVDHIILAGGVARLPRLAESIQEQLGITTTIANPFAHMQISEAIDSEKLFRDAPSLMVACGLSLRNIE